MRYVSDDIHVLAQTLYGEARNDEQAALVAIGWSIRNRAENVSELWPSEVRLICKQKGQYRCWDDGNPVMRRMVMVDHEDPSFARAYAIAAMVLAGGVKDPTAGCDSYQRSEAPSAKSAIVICGREFYRRRR